MEFLKILSPNVVYFIRVNESSDCTQQYRNHEKLP